MSGTTESKFHLIASGGCWLHLPYGNPVALNERDLLFLPHNAPHLVTNSPEPPADSTPRNLPAQVVAGPSTTLICGRIEFTQNYWNPLIEALPEYLILPTNESNGSALSKVVDALIVECEANRDGSSVVIDRLSDILFIEIVRTYVTQSKNSSFLAAISDPKLSKALAAFHAEPGGPWSVRSLANVAGMSRSAFAERFQGLVGLTPMSYVGRWRMQHAHHLLTSSSTPLHSIATQCGYSSDEAFTKAFKKEFGQSPAGVRRREELVVTAPLVSVSSDGGQATKIMFTPSEAMELYKKGEALFVDVRDECDYQAGHLPGAVNIPELFYTLSMTTPEGLEEMESILVPLFSRAGVSKDKKVIVYENSLTSRFGGSCRGYFQLSFFGHPNAGILDGGLERWQLDGYAVSSEESVVEPAVFEPAIRHNTLATVDDMIAALSDPNIKLLDNRDKEEWLGIVSSPVEYYTDDFLPRRGRIPGARWVEWYNFMEDHEGYIRFRPPDQIRGLCAQVGLYPDDEIIVYCFKGARAANTFVALKLSGFNHVRNYYGSWNEWARNPSLPVMSVSLSG